MRNRMRLQTTSLFVIADKTQDFYIVNRTQEEHMESHDVLRNATENLGVKSVASSMNLSSSLVYKWCQPKDTPEASGADNPLDRVLRIRELTGDLAPIHWLCQKSNGFFVENPKAGSKPAAGLLQITQSILKEFSELLEAVSGSYTEDQAVDATEAKRIRREWEELKSITEGFVTACEKGSYASERKR